jgi:hypothetical protein
VSGEERRDRAGAAQDKEPPRKDIDLGECHVASAYLERHDEVSKRCGDSGDDEEEDHDHPVKGEERVIGLGRNDMHAGPDELKTHGKAEAHTDGEERERREQVQEADPLMIGCEYPSENAGICRLGVIEACFHRTCTALVHVYLTGRSRG